MIRFSNEIKRHASRRRGGHGSASSRTMSEDEVLGEAAPFGQRGLDVAEIYCFDAPGLGDFAGAK